MMNVVVEKPVHLVSAEKFENAVYELDNGTKVSYGDLYETVGSRLSKEEFKKFQNTVSSFFYEGNVTGAKFFVKNLYEGRLS